MEYKFVDDVNIEDFKLPESDKISNILLKNHSADVFKALDFLDTEGKLLYIHGFLGTGKRQFINYISDFFAKDVIKLEYHCKASTVCDDILLSFIDNLEKNPLSKGVMHTTKISTLAVKFHRYISSIKKPFIIIIHSFDDIEESNRALVADCFSSLSEESNTKIIVSSRAMIQNILGDLKVDKKIFLKALTKENFRDYIKSNKINGTEDAINDFYKYSRGYYYYAALGIKIIQAMKISLNEFLSKYTMSGMSFDSYLGLTYVNLIPKTIRNFFWFLRTLRHGISLNALAVLELYDDFSIGYLKNNLMIYQADEIIYVQDYFQQDIDISIPVKTEIRLHKYIINLYEKELKESLQARAILISRLALRNEIEYHKERVDELENKKDIQKSFQEQVQPSNKDNKEVSVIAGKDNVTEKRQVVKTLVEEKKYTEAIEANFKIIDEFSKDLDAVAEIRTDIAHLYYITADYAKSQHYYELAESYYKKREEYINLNYLYYELTKVYYAMYKVERAEETIKKVIYSVDTPQSLMVDSCILLGNIYSETQKQEEAYKYYVKAIESVDENTSDVTKSELYFRTALACDEKGDNTKAFEYYKKCIQIEGNNTYKALSYSNLGACYYENEDYAEAEKCFLKSYELEKNNNNYDGIYYTASYLAKIYIDKHSEKALVYLIEAKQSAEFINDEFCILEATIALGDYYYNSKDKKDKALTEYLKAQMVAQNYGDLVDINKITERINDMKLRIENNQ